MPTKRGRSGSGYRSRSGSRSAPNFKKLKLTKDPFTPLKI